MTSPNSPRRAVGGRQWDSRRAQPAHRHREQINRDLGVEVLAGIEMGGFK